MMNLSNSNGLAYWMEDEIITRRQIAEYFKFKVRQIFQNQNSAFCLHEVEAPILIKSASSSYAIDDMYSTGDFVLRPETTQGSYEFSKYFFQNGGRVPMIIMQNGKSFRREQDQVTKNMCLKEFYQQEFQCFFKKDSKNDYFMNVIDDIKKMISTGITRICNIEISDRLPNYSLSTYDIVCPFPDRNMEICSISKRIDYPYDDSIANVEIAIGLDRCVYAKNWQFGD